jgi:HD-GYP domain-containing protein (c-di-GMP phosphodiesterase class II)
MHRVMPHHWRTILTLLAAQAVCLAFGLTMQYIVATATIDVEALQAATAKLESLAQSLRQPLKRGAVSDRDAASAFCEELAERMQSSRLPSDLGWLAVDSQWRVLATGRTSEDIPSLDELVGQPLPWGENFAVTSLARGQQGTFTAAGEPWAAAAVPIDGSPFRCVVAMPADLAPVPVSAFHRSRMVVGVIVFLWTAAIQGIAVYMVAAGALEKLSKRNVAVEADNLRQAQALVRTRDALILGMATLAESRDDATGLHLDRVSAYATHLAMALARNPKYVREITPEFLELIGISAALHDIGKVGIEDAILLKPGRLCPEEQLRMQQHTTIGGRCLNEIERRLGSSNFLGMVRQVVLFHHERWDGKGYPQGLSGTDIPLPARIVALTDVYDAMCSVRAYKGAMTHDECVAFLRGQSGIMFDPDLVQAFLEHEDDFRDIASHYANGDRAAPDFPAAKHPSEAGQVVRLAGLPGLGGMSIQEPSHN